MSWMWTAKKQNFAQRVSTFLIKKLFCGTFSYTLAIIFDTFCQLFRKKVFLPIDCCSHVFTKVAKNLDLIGSTIVGITLT